MGYFSEPNITRPYELLEYANVTTDGAFGATIILCVAVISFVALYRSGWKPAFMGASFITGLTAILLKLVEAVNDAVLYITIFAILASLAGVLWKTRYT